MARPAVLSHQIEAIEYVHAGDGQPYRHDFERDGSTITLERDGSVRVRNPRYRLWGDFDDMKFLKNPRGKASRRRRKPRVHKRRRHAVARRNPSPKVITVARRKKVRRRRNPAVRRVHHRRRHRRNPPSLMRGFSLNNVINSLTQGAIDGVTIVGGRFAAKLARQKLGYQPGDVIGAGVQAGVGIALALLGPMALPRDSVRMLVAGAFSSPIEEFVKGANIPIVSAALGEVGPFDTYTFGAPRPTLLGDGSYPTIADDTQLGGYSDEPAYIM